MITGRPVCARRLAVLRCAVTAALGAAFLVSPSALMPAEAATLPGEPSYVAGQQADQSVVLTWGPPADTDFAAITGFVACLDATRCVTLPRTQWRTTFGGLVNGQRYYPYVAATTSAGQGPSASVTGGVLAAGAPGAPTDVDVFEVRGGLARVSWSGVDGRGQDPQYFTVRRADGSDPRSLGVADWNASPPDPEGAGYYFVDVPLYPGQHVDFVVTATNSTGTGPGASISFDMGDPFILLPGDVLAVGEDVLSVSSRYYLVQQPDGNVVLSHYLGRPVWHSWTWGRPGGGLAFQEDGNLVAYGRDGAALWLTDTWGHPDAALNIDDDGRIVIFDGDGTTLWSSRPDTGTWWPNDRMGSAEHLTSAQTLYSPNAAYRFTMQYDGNAVVYGPGGRVAWHSWTFGRPNSRLVLQADGNLVVYTPDRRPAWNAGTWGNPGSYMVMQDDGNLVVYAANGRPLWSSMYGRVR